ncbi:ABC transporter substrate-binding protein [Andreprevotia sp. IGB-42]|uniref:substrate-binding periplasmic protein n=1 Tax=Andreprevotia sp. IGB-42 TaxID=2497473 RepID=UPI001359FEFF|nr:transporter substrate-binding domain-containing protein [Andreprevotia sp. IGB-42]
MNRLAKWAWMAVAGLAVTAHADNLRFSVTESWVMPLARLEQGRLADGILFDLMSQIAVASGYKAEFVTLPRKRVDAAFADGTVDVRCYVSRSWVQRSDAYRWSGPLFSNEDMIVSLQPRPAVNTLADFTGARLGTVLGYVYPALEDEFRSGALLRDDAADELTTLRKARLGRTDLVVMHRLLIDWVRKQDPTQPLYLIYPVQRFDAECGVSKRSRIDATRVLAAIETMRRNGDIERILQRYR